MPLLNGCSNQHSTWNSHIGLPGNTRADLEELLIPNQPGNGKKVFLLFFFLVLVLQGSVATKLSYGGKFFILVMSHFFLIPTLNEF